LGRINTIAERVKVKPKHFAKFARENSECPTAMQDGLVGEVKRGMLYPELDAVLFSLQEGEISEVVESEIGYHILLCEKISPQKKIPRVKAENRIQKLLQERAHRACQKDWLDSLKEKNNDC
jgi:parvulin-like peptidyl-prolyl isomerase